MAEPYSMTTHVANSYSQNIYVNVGLEKVKFTGNEIINMKNFIHYFQPKLYSSWGKNLIGGPLTVQFKKLCFC